MLQKYTNDPSVHLKVIVGPPVAISNLNIDIP
jgi:hypothetical protein